MPEVGSRLVTIAALAAALLPAAPAAAGPCGLPDATPVYVEFADGSVTFRDDVFRHPGIVVGSAGSRVPQVLREGGATTMYWEMNLDVLVGTPAEPEDPATIVGAAETLYDRAVSSTGGCHTPWIALNELQGSRLPGPWSTTNATYRENVLVLMAHLTALGAHPFLLVPSAPAVDGEAGDWWADAAAVGSLVAEVYFGAPVVHARGPVVGPRMVRQAFRKRIEAYLELGVPIDRLGLMLGFQSGRGAAGREGLEPTSAWLDYVKGQALAAREVTAETGLATIWSWGWGTFGPQSADADKAAAACVYLWARDPTLCDPLTRLPLDAFDPSRNEGPIVLEPDSICETADGRIAADDLAVMTAIYRNRGRAFTHLLARTAEGAEAGVPDREIDAALTRIVAQRFGGDAAAFNAAMTALGLNERLTRELVADQLRRARLVSLVDVGRLSYTQVSELYAARGGRWARRVGVDPAPEWLHGEATGWAIEGMAPSAIFAGKKGRTLTVRLADGPYRVKVLGKRMRLHEVPLAAVYPLLADELRARARVRRLPAWLLDVQKRALATTVCVRDVLPAVGTIDAARAVPALNVSTLRR
jgi:hypothetical protein